MTTKAPIIYATDDSCHLLEPIALFYWALRQVVAQGKIGMVYGNCRYRLVDLDGKLLRCAAGHCIPDKDAAYIAEGASIGKLEYSPESYNHMIFLSYLKERFSEDQLIAMRVAQRVHDHGDWNRLTTIAASTNLVFKDLHDFLETHRELPIL